jgi:hypothetical protein
MTIKLDIGKSRFATPVRTGQHQPNFPLLFWRPSSFVIQSPYDSIFLFACLFLSPLSVTIKRVWLVQKGAGRTVPRSRAEKIRRQTAGEQWKKIKKREIEQKRKTEQKDEKRKKATNWNERIRKWKSSIRRMGRKELEAHIYRCHRKMKPGKMLPTYTLGILVQHQAKHAPKARRLGRRSVGVCPEQHWSHCCSGTGAKKLDCS